MCFGSPPQKKTILCSTSVWKGEGCTASTHFLQKRSLFCVGHPGLGGGKGCWDHVCSPPFWARGVQDARQAYLQRHKHMEGCSVFQTPLPSFFLFGPDTGSSGQLGKASPGAHLACEGVQGATSTCFARRLPRHSHWGSNPCDLEVHSLHLAALLRGSHFSLQAFLGSVWVSPGHSQLLPPCPCSPRRSPAVKNGSAAALALPLLSPKTCSVAQAGLPSPQDPAVGVPPEGLLVLRDVVERAELVLVPAASGDILGGR